MKIDIYLKNIKNSSMLKELVEKIKKLSRERVPFDSSKFNDPIESQTDWSPLKSGGANFKTHNLVQINSNRIVYKSSIGAKLFYSVFIFVGLALIIGFSLAKNWNDSLDFSFDSIFPILFGSVFAIIGTLLLLYGTKPIVFEKGSGYYWKGRKNPESVYNIHEVKNFTKLKDIHALQIIAEYIRGNKTSYYSYELNLVLNDGSRLNVVDHGNLKKIRQDAQKLSLFLRKPAWDATTQTLNPSK